MLLLAAALPVTGAPPPEDGSHIVAHAWTRDGFSGQQLVFGVDTIAGNPVLRVYFEDGSVSTGGRFWATDGDDLIELPWQVGNGWHRIDAVLHGDTLTLHLNLLESITLDAINPATTGVAAMEENFGAGNPTGLPVYWTRIRTDNDDLARETTFTTPLSETGWSVYPDDSGLFERPAQRGHQSAGYAELRPPRAVEQMYLYAPTHDLGDHYVLAASVAPAGTQAFPGRAALAGFAGDFASPDIAWTVTAAMAPNPLDGWAFYFQGDGLLPQQISPAYDRALFRAISATVDEATGTLTLQAEGGDPMTADLPGTTDFVGIGDIFDAPTEPLTTYILKVDDLAAYGVEA